MTAILDTVLPVFAVIFAGFAVGRWGVLGEAGSETLNRFVYYGALPALFVISTAPVALAEIFNWPFLAAYLGGMAATAALALGAARAWSRGRPSAFALNALAATFANTGYLGIPLLLTAFGEGAALPAVIATVLNGAVVMALAIAVIEADLSHRAGAFAIARDAGLGVIKSPLVLAAAAGILLSATQTPLPAAIATFLALLGAAAPPAALFAIGLFLAERRFAAPWREVSWIAFLKLLVHPAVTWIIAVPVLGLAPDWAAAVVLLAALPTGSLVFVLAQEYGHYTQRAAAAILVTTALSVVSVSALFALMGWP